MGKRRSDAAAVRLAPFELHERPGLEVVGQQDLERAAAWLGLRQRRQTRLDVLSDRKTRLLAGLLQCDMIDRSQRTALPMCPGDYPRFVPTGLDTQDQASNEDVPDFVGFELGLGLGD